MAKIATDISQSKLLAEILPIESADMHYVLEKRNVPTGYELGLARYLDAKKYEGKCNIISFVPAWSLSALMDCIPKLLKVEGKLLGLSMYIDHNNEYCFHYVYGVGNHECWWCSAVEPIDACVKMIKLLKEKYLI